MQERSSPRLTPTESELAYIAGIIDGEGTIGIYKGREPYNYRLVLIVTNTHVPMLEWLQSRLGGSLVRSGSRPSPLNKHKQVWQVVLWQARAAATIQACRPYLIIKAAQADRGLRFMREFVSFRGIRTSVSDDQIRRRQWYFEQAHLLNCGKSAGLPKKRA